MITQSRSRAHESVIARLGTAIVAMAERMALAGGSNRIACAKMVAEEGLEPPTRGL